MERFHSPNNSPVVKQSAIAEIRNNCCSQVNLRMTFVLAVTLHFGGFSVITRRQTIRNSRKISSRFLIQQFKCWPTSSQQRAYYPVIDPASNETYFLSCQQPFVLRYSKTTTFCVSRTSTAPISTA